MTADCYGGIVQVISGGQSGADQGGLMAAWERGIPTGGWAPRGYRTNSGQNPLLEVLGLKQMEDFGYTLRTCKNVETADVTLIFGYDLTSAGSRQTARYAQEINKPYFQFEHPIGATMVSREVQLIENAVAFIVTHRPIIVNVAGNRDTGANDANFTTTRRVFGKILDLVSEHLSSS